MSKSADKSRYSKRAGYTDAQKAEYFKKKFQEAMASNDSEKALKYKRKARKSGVAVPKYAGVPKVTVRPKATVELSECSKEYAACLLNPCGADPSCIPSLGACHSSKMKVSARGSFATSTYAPGTNAAMAGFGFICYRPGTMITNNPGGTLPGVQSVLASSTTYSCSPVVGYASVINNTLPNTQTGTLVFNSNSPYTNTDIGVYNPNGGGGGVPTGGLTYRLVSACLRIKYTGTTLNCAGSIYSITEPDHMNLGTNAGGVGIGAVTAYPSCNNTSVEAAQHDWVELINGGPISPQEMEYCTGISNDPANNAYMAFLISVPPNTSLTFDFEAWANFEVIGPQVRQKTASFADPVGLNIVNNGVQSAMAAGGQQDHHGKKSFMMKALEFIGHAAQKSLTYVFSGNSEAPSIKGFAKEVLPKLIMRAAPLLM